MENADRDRKIKDGYYRIIMWDCIKWYPDIEGFENVYFFGSLDSYEIEYDFARIGEAVGDYEVGGNLNSGLICPDQHFWFDDE